MKWLLRTKKHRYIQGLTRPRSLHLICVGRSSGRQTPQAVHLPAGAARYSGRLQRPCRPEDRPTRLRFLHCHVGFMYTCVTFLYVYMHCVFGVYTWPSRICRAGTCARERFSRRRVGRAGIYARERFSRICRAGTCARVNGASDRIRALNIMVFNTKTLD